MSGESVCIALAAEAAAIARCWPVMRELRPHLTDEAAFVERVRRQQRDGSYQLAYLEAGGEVRALAGYRLWEKLLVGPHLYVDDLVTRAADHSKGYGQRLFDWVVERAREAGCATLELDSGVQRHGAHRFYLCKRMDITSHHFVLKL